MKLRIWWIPQVPMKPFYIPVNTIQEAALIYATLALYDIFQFQNHIKPDYCNIGGLEYFDETEQSWFTWQDENSGLEFLKYIEKNKLNKITDIKNMNTL